MSVSLFLMHSHSFERNCSKFSMWHSYILWMVMGGSERHSSPRTRALRTVLMCCRSVPVVDIWLAGCKTSFVGKIGSSGPQAQLVERRSHQNRTPCTQAVTEWCRHENGSFGIKYSSYCTSAVGKLFREGPHEH